MTFDEILKGKVLTYNTNKAFDCSPPLSSLPSLPQRPFCVVGRLGRKKRKRAGDDGKGKERRVAFSHLFPLLSPLARFLFFHYCYFCWRTQREPLRRGEDEALSVY